MQIHQTTILCGQYIKRTLWESLANPWLIVFKPVVLKGVGNSGIYLRALSNKVGIYTAYMIVVFVACTRLSEYLRRRENKTCMQPLPTRIFCISHAVTIFTHYHKLLETGAGSSCSGSSRRNVRFIDSETWNTYMSVIVILFLATVWNHKREDIDILENNCCKWYCFFLSLPASLFFVSDTVEQRFFASCKFVQDSVGFWIPRCGFQIPNNFGRFRILCQRNLDSRFKIVGGIWILWAELRMLLKPRISNSTRKNVPYSEIRIPLQMARFSFIPILLPARTFLSSPILIN